MNEQTPRLTGTIREVSGEYVFIRSMCGERDWYANRRDLDDTVNRCAHIGMAVTFAEHGYHNYSGDDMRAWAIAVRAES